MARREVIAAAVAAGVLPARLAAQTPVPVLAPGVIVPGVRLQPETEAMVTVAGGRIYARINGPLKGKHLPILFIHGGPGSSHWSWLNATALADDRAVILYDQLDCGRSDRPGDAANWTVPRFVAEIEAIRAHFGIARWHVLGGSWGGTLALEYAARRPAALAGVVLQSPLVSTDLWLRDAALLKSAMPADIRALLDGCDTPGVESVAACEAATDYFYARHVRRTAVPPAFAAYRDGLPVPFAANLYNHMWGRAEFTCTGTLKTYDGRPLLPRIDGRRSLFVAGEHDEARPETITAFAGAAGALMAVAPDAAHSIMLDNPGWYLALLRQWLAMQDDLPA